MLEHHCGGPKGADGIGDAFAGDVEGSAVYGFEHGGEAAFRVDIAGGRDAEAAGEGGGEVGKNVGVKIRGHDRIYAGGLGDHTRGHGVDEHLVPGDVGKLSRDFGGDLVPENHAVALGVGFGDNSEKFSRALLGELESEAHDSGDTAPGEDGCFRGDLFGKTAVGSATLAGIFAFGVFANDRPVKIGLLA